MTLKMDALHSFETWGNSPKDKTKLQPRFESSTVTLFTRSSGTSKMYNVLKPVV